MLDTRAVLTAIEFEGMSKLKGETNSSFSDSSSDSEKEMTVSTPARDELRKKRDRTGASVSFGNLSGISEVRADHELSSSEGEDVSDVKKPRFISGDHGDGSKDDKVSRILAEDDNMGGGDTLVELHEEVPPDDPGPSGCVGKSPSEGAQ